VKPVIVNSTNWCAAGFPPADLFLDPTSDPASTKSVHPPPLHSCPPYNPPNTVNVQGTKYLGRTHLRSPTLFPPARLPLLLAVCQQPTTLPTVPRPYLLLCFQ
ncbi:hypothetical protein XENORESO_010646, partial [Xenotaenia resolanae]